MKYRNFKPYRKGVFKAWCPVSGLVYYSDQFDKRWDGERVGPEVELERHPQELLKIRPERPLPWTFPVEDDTFLADAVCSGNTITGRIGYGTIGCMHVGNDIAIIPDP